MVVPTIPVSNKTAAREFYVKTLGLRVKSDGSDGLMFECGGGTALLVYESTGAGTSQGTFAAWEVEDLDAEREELHGKGVEFEEYDMPGLKTIDGVAENDGMRSAWFKDPDKNILALVERS